MSYELLQFAPFGADVFITSTNCVYYRYRVCRSDIDTVVDELVRTEKLITPSKVEQVTSYHPQVLCPNSNDIILLFDNLFLVGVTEYET